MPLVIKNYKLSDFNNDLYMTIKNDKKLLEMFFNHLYLAARTSLGFKTKSSNILITKTFSKRQLKSERNRLDLKYKKYNSILVEPEKDVEKQLITTMVLSKKFIQLACNELNKLGSEVNSIHDHRYPIKYPDITMALVEEYWAEMIKFAKENSEYNHNWESSFS